jgi:hypothetical protein
MRFIILAIAWLMVPLAFIVVMFDIAKAAVESKIEAKLRE